MLRLFRIKQTELCTKKNIRKSFTLLELIISMIIGSILFLAITNVFYQSFVMSESTRVYTSMDNFALLVSNQINKDLDKSDFISLTNSGNLAHSTFIKYSVDGAPSKIYYDFTSGILMKQTQSVDSKTLFNKDIYKLNLKDFYFDLSMYSPDLEAISVEDQTSKLVKYSFTLQKTLTNGTSITKKYSFEERCKNEN